MCLAGIAFAIFLIAMCVVIFVGGCVYVWIKEYDPFGHRSKADKESADWFKSNCLHPWLDLDE